jgi:purine-nucleoside phosphorylase
MNETFFISVFRTSYEVIEETAKFLLERTKIRPKIAIVCGSGLGHLADTLIETDVFPYSEVPHFPISTVEGHAGKLIFGRLNGVEVICMQGRFHFYEGYSLAICSMPIRLMKLCGCSLLIVTNAAGGLNPTYKLGDVMIVKDHINIMGFAGNNPLLGPNDLR